MWELKQSVSRGKLVKQDDGETSDKGRQAVTEQVM